MGYRILEHGSTQYLEIDECLDTEQDALDYLVSACGESGVRRVLLDSANLPDRFIDLKTGLAGQILLKLSMYRIKAVAVLTQERIGTGKFYEMALETNRGSQFGVFSDRPAALDWLVR